MSSSRHSAAERNRYAWRVVAGRLRDNRQRHRHRSHRTRVRRRRLLGALPSSKKISSTAKVPPLINCVGPDGKFTAEGPDYCRGRWVKDCDKDIIRDLKQRGLLFHQEQYVHDYPFCWRAEEDPLIQYPRKSWFIRTSRVQRRRCSPTTRKINWLPEHIKDGRFGNFLESNVDWALSPRTLLGHAAADLGVRQDRQDGSHRQLRRTAGQARRRRHRSLGRREKAKPRPRPTTSEVHKPYIDAVTYDSPFAAGARMHRVPEVIDCWYDSGAMPFAQWGYPAQTRQRPALRLAIPGRLHQRSHRPNPRLVLQPAGDQHAAVRRGPRIEEPRTRESPDAPLRRSSAPRPLPPSLPQLHRPRPHARRRRPEDVEEQAELPRRRTKSSTATAPTPCAGTSSPTSRRGPRSATANRRSKTASPSSCCASGTSTASS